LVVVGLLHEAGAAVRLSGTLIYIRGDCVGDKLTLYVDGQKALEAEDSEFESGKIGLIVHNAQNMHT
jgi:hypothetical protein